jgi:hypothetical protein
MSGTGMPRRVARRSACRPVALAAATLALAVPGASFADAAWQWQSWVRFGTGYEDNPRMRDVNPQAVSDVALSVGATLAAVTERSSFELTPSVDLRRYDDPLYDRTDFNAGAHYAHSLDEQSQLTFDATAIQDSTLTSELGTTGISFVDKQRQVLGGGFGYSNQLSERDVFMAGASYSEISYLDARFTGLVDYGYRSAYLAWNRTVSERLTLGALASQSLSNAPATGARDESQSLQLTGSFAFTENVKAEFALGRGRLDSVGATSGNTRVYNFSISGRGEQWHWRAGASQSYQPTGRGVQNRQLNVDGLVARQMSENFELAARVTGIATDESGSRNSDVEYLRASIGGSWRLGRAWYLDFGLAHSEQRRPSTDYSAYGNMVTIGIAWRGDSRPLGGP